MIQQTFLKFCVLFILLTSCNNESKHIKNQADTSKSQNETACIQTMQKHLDAVTNKDLTALESTLSPDGKMQLILPATEITYTVKDFMDYHRDWFALDYDWTFETEILNTHIGETVAMAVTQIVYREPKRDGEPYFNRMTVSYDLKKVNGIWYVIKDHASSVKKSTD